MAFKHVPFPFSIFPAFAQLLFIHHKLTFILFFLKKIEYKRILILKSKLKKGCSPMINRSIRSRYAATLDRYLTVG